MRRRNFIQLGTALAASIPASQVQALQNNLPKPVAQKQTDFMHDGLYLTPLEYSSLLLNIKNTNLLKLKDALEKRNILFNSPGGNGFILKVNPSINYYDAQDLGEKFLAAMKSV